MTSPLLRKLPEEGRVQVFLSGDQAVQAHAAEHDGLALRIAELAVLHLQLPAGGGAGPPVGTGPGGGGSVGVSAGGEGGYQQQRRQQKQSQLFHWDPSKS